MAQDDAIIHLEHLSKSFSKPDGGTLLVLDDINLDIRAGEVVALLGRSGCGKSTLLRVIAGLAAPTSGVARYDGAELTGANPGTAMVFQNFALMPWLTVQQNVELGLAARKVAPAERSKRAVEAIDLIGLDGFESAYPKELSGGMRQRVGFARAIVADPVVLLMDEPFSALDVLTAETLRTDFMDLWTGRQLPTHAALLVTHNIEEAVLMCDRILVLSSNPGRIAAEIPVPLPQPRDRLSAPFRDIVDEIYATLTSRSLESVAAHGPLHAGQPEPLPRASVNQMSGLIEKVSAAPYSGRAELAQIAGDLVLEVDDLFPTVEALHLLEFAELKGGALELTAAGRVFAEGKTDDRKRLFREHLLRFVPLAAHIHRVLDEREGHWAPRVRFEVELEDRLTRREAERTLRTVTGWGRYAELFGYDDKSRRFNAENAA